MKIYVKGSFYLKSNDIYILNVKFIIGNKILPNYEFVNADDSDLHFKVKSLTLGTYNYDDDSFDIVIEKPNFKLENLEKKEFDLK